MLSNQDILLKARTLAPYQNRDEICGLDKPVYQRLLELSRKYFTSTKEQKHLPVQLLECWYDLSVADEDLFLCEADRVADLLLLGVAFHSICWQPNYLQIAVDQAKTLVKEGQIRWGNLLILALARAKEKMFGEPFEEEWSYQDVPLILQLQVVSLEELALLPISSH